MPPGLQPQLLGLDRLEPTKYLLTLFEPTDCIAVLLKSYQTGSVIQRVRPVSWFQTERVLRWLRAMNARKYEVFVSVNSIAPGRYSRRRDAIAQVRHVFIDADHDGSLVRASIEARGDLPPPSYVLHSSPDHVHVMWRVVGFDSQLVERLQKHLALELRTDLAATSVTQTTRMPGFFNHKRRRPQFIAIEYINPHLRYRPSDFPAEASVSGQVEAITSIPSIRSGFSIAERAKRYLASIPPAVEGAHGDLHTFRVCCRLTRGFSLSEDQALRVLAEWNARCEPPWTAAELIQKVRGAFRYGREPIGGLL